MIAFVIFMNLLAQTGIQVTQGVVTPKIFQKGYLTDEEMKAIENTIGGVFMGISEDSNYVYINEKPIKVDKKSFNFKDLPAFGEDIFIRLETKNKEKLAVYCSKDFDEAVTYKKGFLK